MSALTAAFSFTTLRRQFLIRSESSSPFLKFSANIMSMIINRNSIPTIMSVMEMK